MSNTDMLFDEVDATDAFASPVADFTQQLYFAISILLVTGHWKFTQGNLKIGLSKLIDFVAPKETTLEEIQHHERVEAELDQLRITNRRLGTSLAIHVLCLMILESAFRCLTAPSPRSCIKLLICLIVYFHDLQVANGTVQLSAPRVRIINMFLRLALSAYAVAWDPQVSPHQDKVILAALMSMSLEALDWRWTAVHCLFMAVQRIVMDLLHQTGGVEILLEVSSFGLVTIVSALYEHQARSRISAVIKSDEADSMLYGFRQMLRGLADGDVLLDQQFKIVGSTRLKGFVDSCQPGSSFADLLDNKDWQKFLDFATASAGESLPPCMRVTLKSKHAEVGVDLFHVALPSGKGNHHLLAIKEDSESRCFTSTQSMPVPLPLPLQPGGTFSGRASSTSSINEAVDVCNELEEVTLLVNSQFEVHDIEEAHMRFTRRGWLEDSEMPNLKKFAGATQWESIRKTLGRFVQTAQQTGRAPAPIDLGSVMMRVPGQSRTFMKARQVVLSTPDRSIRPGGPLRFWVHLSNFDKKNVRKVHEPTLKDISER